MSPKTLTGFLAVTACAVTAWAADIYVDGSNPCPGSGTADDPYCTIQLGVDNANSGDVIHVAAEIYQENVTIDKSLTLNGAQANVDPRPSAGGRTGDESTIDGGRGSCVTVAADDVIINGFTMLNAGGKDGANACVWITPSRQRISVMYNALSDARYGVWTDDHCQHVVVERNHTFDCGRGVYARTCYYDEVAPVVKENDFYDNYRGVFVYGICRGDSQALVFDNHFEELTDQETDYGIYSYIASFHAKGNRFVNIGTFYPDGYTYPSPIAGVGSTSTADWYDIKRCLAEDNLFVHDNTSTPAVMGYFCDFEVRQNEITSQYIAVWIKGGTGYDPSIPAYAEWTIEKNTISGSAGAQSGVYATGGGYGQSAVSVMNNTITDFDNGVRLVNDGDIVAKATVGVNDLGGNRDFGITNVAANGEVDAMYNWWGDATGPLDTIGTDEAPPCYDPSTMVNADGAGVGVSENVNYCPWLVALPCAGDVDSDGDTDLADLAALLAAYGTSVGDPNYNPHADFDEDGDVDLSDLAFLLADYGCGG